MLFNSLVFAAFFLIVYAAYLLLGRRRRAQNLLLLLSSYVFYGWWDWRFLSLLWISTLIDYTVGRAMGSTTDPVRRRRLLWVSMSANLGMLGFFKYFNFFGDSLIGLCGLVGWHPDAVTLRVVLPVGISFYTFQTMSYGIDVYRGELKAHHSLVEFAAFVAFFPQLVAGPIERAANLLPQFAAPRRITAHDLDTGLYLMVWGYFKKIVVADNLARLVDRVFDAPEACRGTLVVVATVAFAFQIYADFSGYSDIARGLARMMGFKLMVNFRLPFFALNPRDFWARWHISLSTWLRDYLYIPLGGNRCGERRTYRNLAVTMLLGGLWHGAAWNFLIWGAFHGLALILHRRLVAARPVSGEGDIWRSPAGRLVCWAGMTALTMVGWFIFRVHSWDQAVAMLSQFSLATAVADQEAWVTLLCYATPLVLSDAYQQRRGDLLAQTRWPFGARCALYTAMVTAIVLFGAREAGAFIYFQF